MDARIPFQPLPIDQSHVVYGHGPDSWPQPGVAAGRTTRLHLTDSRSFPGTGRDIWVLAPAASDGALPCIVFQADALRWLWRGSSV